MFARRRACLITVGMAVFSCAGSQQPSAQAGDGQDRDLVPRERLSDQALLGVLDAAVATQELLNQVSAEFRLTYFHNLQRTPESYLALYPHLKHNDGIAEGTIEWRRDGVKQWLRQTFDVPKEFQVQQYESKLYVDDGEKQISQFLRTSQGMIVESGELRMVLPPVAWFRPVRWGGLAELRAKPEVTWEGYSEAEGRVLVRFSMADGAGETLVADAWLSPELDHAIVEWRIPLWQQHATIEYARDAQNRVYPTSAILRVLEPDGTQESRRFTLETLSLAYGAPDAASLAFPFRPGMAFADNRLELNEGKVKGLRVADDGSLEEVQSFDPTPAVRLSRRGSVGIGAVAILGVVLALCFRAYIVQAKR